MQSRSLRIFLGLVSLLYFISACTSRPLDQKDHVPISIEPTETAFSPASTLTPTPTARVFTEPDSCALPTASGHILFLQTSLSNPSGYDLYIMDGSACSKHLLMRDAFGSPAWSVDGKYISVGCENGESICILDASASLGACLKPDNNRDDCVPLILKKYALPSRFANIQVYNTSWSYDGRRVLVESGDFSGYVVYVDVLILDEGNWQPIIEGDKFVHPEMSPVENEIMFDGIYIMPLDDGPVKAKWYGYDGVWAYDGTKIAFLRPGPDDDREPVGIAEWSFIKTPHWRWLYEPRAMDRHYWPSQNLDIGGSNYRMLSWSLDGRYLAFVAKRALYDSQIFRLDTATGETVILTTRFEEKQGYRAPVNYYAPAWGP